jgi:hypothetical protein
MNRGPKIGHVLIQLPIVAGYECLRASIPPTRPIVPPYRAKQHPKKTSPCVLTDRVLTLERDGIAQPSSPIPGIASGLLDPNSSDLPASYFEYFFSKNPCDAACLLETEKL